MQPKCILLVEDNSVTQKLSLLQLRKLGFQVEAVGNGYEAVLAVTDGRYALVLMDCQMPEMDGFEATRTIRRQEHRTHMHIPIIALTANVMKGDREKCLAAGMDDFLPKTGNMQELRAMIERWIEPTSM